MPGFIDAHTHLSQSFGKALAFGEPSEIFRRIWVPLEATLDDEGIYLAAKLAALEALRGGFTTVVDAGTRSATGLSIIATACQDAGIRTVLGAICNDLDAPDPQPILADARRHIAKWQHDELIHPSLAISIPEVATDTMLRAVSDLSAEAGVIFQTHANEHLVAIERSLVARQRRPIQLLHHLGALGPQVLLAHATLLTPDEIAALQATDTAIAYNPVATQWKGNATAPRHPVRRPRHPLRHRHRRHKIRRLPADRCRGGQPTPGIRPRRRGFLHRRRLVVAGPGNRRRRPRGRTGRNHRAASSRPALAADFLIIDLDVPEMLPSWDLTWELVRLANRDQIVASFVAGRMRLWHGWPIDWDARALMQQVRQRAAGAVANAPIQRIHATADVHRAVGHRAMGPRAMGQS